MDSVKNYLKNKSVGFYIAIADAVLAIITAIVFFATYNGAMANNAAGQVPETIGIFLIAGAVIEIAALLLPQYRFIHLGAVVMYCVSLMKEIFLIPNLIADEINNVHYQGGNLATNEFYIIMQFIIVLSGIVAVFIGFLKSEEGEDAKWSIKMAPLPIAKVAAGAVLVVAATLSSTLVASNMKKNANKAGEGETSSEVNPEVVYDPITDDIKAAAEAYDYDFDPTSVLIKEQETWDYSDSDLSKLSFGATREGHNLVYYFEGRYSEGYQGQYNEYFTYLYLWDDGLYAGKSNSTNFKGFWYNSSIERGVDENGNDIKDCLIMVSNTNKYESLIAEDISGFYDKSVYVHMNPGWGDGRSIIVSGYMYYPDVAIFIDTAGDTCEYKVGDKFDRSAWTANHVTKNLKYSSVWKPEEVTWTNESGMVDGNSKFTAAGEYTVTAKWNGFEATQKIVVTA